MRNTRGALALIMGFGLLLALGGDLAHAQDGGYAPPPPPPPPAPDTTAPAPPPPADYAQPPPPRRRRPRYRPSRWGRFYVGAGGGYVIPGGELGQQLKSGGAYGAWLGWRKRWIGFELGYLGAQLTPAPSEQIIVNDGIDPPTDTAHGVIGSPPVSRLSHITADMKLFLRLFCSSTIFGRIGINYTELDQAGGTKHTGYGYQYGAGIDYRIRLGYRPDLILKLRAEVVHMHANLTVGESEDRRLMSGLYMMFYLNLGWSPR